MLLENIGNPFSSTLYRAVDDVARARGVNVYASNLDEDPERESELVRSLVERDVEGLIIAPSSTDHAYLEDARYAGTKFVFIDRPSLGFEADAILTDNQAGASVGVEHLVALGHERIAYLGDIHSIATAADRYAGYVEALVQAGITVDEHLVRHDLHTMGGAQAAVSDLLRGPEAPTALFAAQNLVTIGAIRALHKLARHRDVALVGFDDLPLGDLLFPGITVVAQQPYKMGELAAQALFSRLDGNTEPARYQFLQANLITRGSGEIPAA